MATITQVICDKCRGTSNVSAIDWEVGRETGQVDLCGTCLRRVIKDLTPGPATKTSPSSKQPSQAEVRAWAKSQGIKVPDKGRVPTEVMQKYSRRGRAAPPLEAIS